MLNKYREAVQFFHENAGYSYSCGEFTIETAEERS